MPREFYFRGYCYYLKTNMFRSAVYGKGEFGRMAAYKSDIEIAQETELMSIEDIASKLGLTRADIEL